MTSQHEQERDYVYIAITTQWIDSINTRRSRRTAGEPSSSLDGPDDGDARATPVNATDRATGTAGPSQLKTQPRADPCHPISGNRHWASSTSFRCQIRRTMASACVRLRLLHRSCPLPAATRSPAAAAITARPLSPQRYAARIAGRICTSHSPSGPERGRPVTRRHASQHQCAAVPAPFQRRIPAACPSPANASARRRIVTIQLCGQRRDWRAAAALTTLEPLAPPLPSCLQSLHPRSRLTPRVHPLAASCCNSWLPGFLLS